MSDFNSNNFKQTEWNGAQLTFMRIHNLMIEYQRTLARDEYENAFKVLRSLKIEAIMKMDHKKKDNICTEDCVLCKSHNDYKRLQRSFEVFRATNSNIHSPIGIQLLSSVEDYAEFITTYMEKRGMFARDERMVDDDFDD